jgi:hypothetical protein
MAATCRQSPAGRREAGTGASEVPLESFGFLISCRIFFVSNTNESIRCQQSCNNFAYSDRYYQFTEVFHFQSKSKIRHELCRPCPQSHQYGKPTQTKDTIVSLALFIATTLAHLSRKMKIYISSHSKSKRPLQNENTDDTSNFSFIVSWQ